MKPTDISLMANAPAEGEEHVDFTVSDVSININASTISLLSRALATLSVDPEVPLNVSYSIQLDNLTT